MRKIPNKPNLTRKGTTKRTSKAQIQQKIGNNKNQVELNEIKTEKINETKINKTDKALARQGEKKAQISKIRNK